MLILIAFFSNLSVKISIKHFVFKCVHVVCVCVKKDEAL